MAGSRAVGVDPVDPVKFFVRQCPVCPTIAMKHLLYAWEWGAGVGHLARFAPLAQQLVESGMRVTVAARDLTHASRYFPSDRFEIRQAPTSVGSITPRVSNPSTMSGLAWNLGYNSPQRIRGFTHGWAGLVRDTNPDAVLSDFGIGAAIAAHAHQVPHFRMGTGFECPPLSSPLLPFRYHEGQPHDDAAEIERQQVEWISSAISELHSGAALDSFATLVGSADSTLLCTIREFDHYDRDLSDADYFGVWSPKHGSPVSWAGRSELRAFAYLKPFRALPALLKALTDHNIEVALTTDVGHAGAMAGVDQTLIVPQSDFVDLDDVKRTCRFAITNSNHGTSISMLSAGIPVLALPMFIEQRITANRIAELGLGQTVNCVRPVQFPQAVADMLYAVDTTRLDAFAQKHDFDSDAAPSRVGKALLEMLQRT
jgi:hypothetical protein